MAMFLRPLRGFRSSSLHLVRVGANRFLVLFCCRRIVLLPFVNFTDAEMVEIRIRSIVSHMGEGRLSLVMKGNHRCRPDFTLTRAIWGDWAASTIGRSASTPTRRVVRACRAGK